MNDATHLATGLDVSRILVIDDNQAIHEDFRKIFGASRGRSTLSAAELALFGDDAQFADTHEFHIDSAYQGQEGLALVRLAQEQQSPYAMAFVDVRMPPGWDGIETTARIWEHDPDIQIVICTAYSDYSWSEMLEKLGRSDRLVILKKPFDTIEVVQLASALAEKWRLARQSRSIMEDLERRVTERTRELVQAGERLQASETQYRVLFDSNPHPMWVYDTETLRFVMVNGAAVQHYGYSEQQFRAMTIRDILPVADDAALERNVGALKARGKRFGEWRHLKQDGSLIDVEISSDRIVFNGRPARLVLSHDVTERKRAAWELRQSESLKGAILESSLDCLITIDHEGKIVEFNPAAEATFGLTREQALGNEMVELIVPPRLRDAHRRGFAHYLATGEGPILGKRLELQAIRADGTEFPIELAITAIGATSTPMFTGFIRDITARKEADEKIRRLNRVYAVLSGIDTLIVRVQGRQELFNEACRIAVDHGAFAIAWIGLLDPGTLDVTAVAWAGTDAENLARMKATARSELPEGRGVMGRAIRTKKPVFNNDISAENRSAGLRREEALRRGYRSLIALPLLVDDEVVGNLSLYAREPNFFNEDEIKLLTELARNVSFALEHISRQQKLDKLSRIRAVLSAVNAAIVRIPDRKELLEEACRIAKELGNFPMAWISTLDRKTESVEPVAWAGLDDEFVRQLRVAARAEGLAGEGTTARAVRSKRAAWENDVAANPDTGYGRRYAIEHGVRSVITLPLLVEGEVEEVFSIYTEETGFFTEDEVRGLEEMASDFSLALQSIARQQKLDKLSRTRAVSSGIRSALVRVRNRQELFQESCRIAVEDGQFPLAWIGALDAATQDVTPVAWAGESAEEITRGKSSGREDSPQGKGAVGRAIRERRPVFSNDISANSFGGPRVQEILRLGFRSQLTLPLFEDQAVAGTLTMYAREPDFFDEEELRLLTELAGDISFALENISRQQKLDKLARIRAVSSEINAAIIRIHDREALLREACRIASEHGKFELVWNALVDQDKERIEPIAWAGFSSETAHSITWASRGAAGFIAEVIRTRKVAVRTDDVNADPPAGLREDALKRGFRSSACVPFMVGDRVVAAMTLFAAEREFFDAEEVALLNEVAGNISFALEHIEKEQRIARLSRIQAVTGNINALIVRVHDRQELFDEACRIAVEHGGFGIAWIGTLDPQTLDVTPIAHAGFEANESLANFKSSASAEQPRGSGVVGRAMRERVPVFVNDLSKEPGGSARRTEAIRRGYQSRIALPLLMDGNAVGVMVLFARERDFFNEEELKLLSQLARDISFAVENLAKQQKIDKLSRIRAVSSEINAAIVRIRESKALLEEVGRIVAERGKFEMTWIGAIDHDKQDVRPVAWTGFSKDTAHAVDWSTISAVTGTLGEAMRTRKPSVRNDIEGELRRGKLRQEALQHGCRSSVCLPLLVDNRVTGLVALFATGRGFFDQDELALLDEVASDISFALQAIEKQKRLDYLAYYDVLTGLANRSLFLERVTSYMRSAVSGGHKLALFMIDLERFKNINDSLGRSAGDTLLMQVAQWMRLNMGDASLLARVGADHFAIVMPEVKQDGSVARLLDRMMAAFQEHTFHLDDAAFRIAAKVGVACFPDDGADADTLFRNAEAALKKAKASGERYLFYTQGMTATVAGRLTMENQLRRALDDEEFVLHYQPKVNLATGKMTSAEALIRWNDPRTGLVAPGQFIACLEETGLIYDVGRWALRKAIEDYLRWRSAGLPAVRVAVNVSPLQLRNRGFVAEIEQVIGIDAQAAAGLELEITESLIMEDVKHSIASLQVIGGMGVSIAIDDFGTGFSSLSYLSKLPVHTLKIDRSFVIDMTSGPQGLALVSTIISLAHSLKLKVVAEGVETEEQSRLLRLLSCDEMQGYLFSAPVPGEIFETRFLALPLAA